MTVIAFAGPSVPPADRTAFTGVEWRAPAEAGDLLRLRTARPAAVCLIDGYFDHRPAVRHKEILLLLSEGVTVFGASSIGALRAAEMDGLGMIGVGAIYGAFAGGKITGDDEVALVHGPAEWGWRPLSVPLVDVRATLIRALRSKVLAAADARAVLRRAAAIHYVDRTWGDILASSPLPRPVRRAMENWLPAGHVEQKRLDAVACLKKALAESATQKGSRPAMVTTRFLTALAAECGIEPRSGR